MVPESGVVERCMASYTLASRDYTVCSSLAGGARRMSYHVRPATLLNGVHTISGGVTSCFERCELILECYRIHHLFLQYEGVLVTIQTLSFILLIHLHDIQQHLGYRFQVCVHIKMLIIFYCGHQVVHHIYCTCVFIMRV